MNFSSIIDKNYISRLDGLLTSLRKYESNFQFYIVALDEETFLYYLSKTNCIPIRVQEIHAFYPQLDKIKADRDTVSYIFTISPFYPSFLF